jgi:hypothetical protein
MAEQTNITALLIGGGLTLAGTVASQVFGLLSGWINRRRQFADLQRERLEKMSDCIAESVEWSQNIMTLSSLQSVRDAYIPKQVRQAVMLAKIYFPTLEEPASEYMNALCQYHVAAVTAIASKPPDAPPGTAVGTLMYLNREKPTQIDSEQLVLRNKLDDAIAAEAKKYQHV